jgi:hypothetical protein
MRLLGYQARINISSAVLLLSGYITAEVLLKLKGPCAGRRLEPALVCIPAEFSGLVLVDYFVIFAVGIIAATSIWLALTKLESRRKQRAVSYGICRG